MERLTRKQLREKVKAEWEDIAKFQWFGTPFAWVDAECTQKSPALHANDLGLWVFSQPDDPFIVTRATLLELHDACISAKAWIRENVNEAEQKKETV